MFVGTYDYTIVDGNVDSTSSRRIVMSSHFRSELGSDFYIFLQKSGCLRLYTPQIWNDFAESKKKRLTDAEMSDMDEEEVEYIASEVRDFFGNVYSGKMDKQGRITLNGKMLEHANIKDEITMLGMQDFIEIWNPEDYEINRKKRKAKAKV